MHLVPLLIACAVSGPAIGDQPKEPLTNDGLREINRSFLATHQFNDNEFLYEEKQAEVVETAERFAGRPVRVEVRVVRVTRERVDVTFFPDQEEPERRFGDRADDGEMPPQVAFVEGPDTEVEFHTERSRVPRTGRDMSGLGGTIAGGRHYGRLAVPELVPVELARQLRQGDRLVITGTLQAVTPAPAITFRTESGVASTLGVAGFVITGAKAEKAGDQDGREAP